MPEDSKRPRDDDRDDNDGSDGTPPPGRRRTDSDADLDVTIEDLGDVTDPEEDEDNSSLTPSENELVLQFLFPDLYENTGPAADDDEDANSLLNALLGLGEKGEEEEEEEEEEESETESENVSLLPPSVSPCSTQSLPRTDVSGSHSSDYTDY